MYSPTTSLIDPPAESPITDGVLWVQGVALGSAATVIAILAVAAIGLLMLSGRLELRRGITVALGCFILFGSAGIAAVLIGLTGADALPTFATTPEPGPLRTQMRSATPPVTAYDPYAGASVPTTR